MPKPRGIHGCSIVAVRTSPHSRNVWRNNGAAKSRKRKPKEPPTMKQLEYADVLAKRHGIKRPYFESKGEAGLWISAHKA